jgi:septin 6/8/11
VLFRSSFSFFRLKSIDLVCMKKLDTKVNIIPIIAKADTISKTELQKFKVSVLKYHGCQLV